MLVDIDELLHISVIYEVKSCFSHGYYNELDKGELVLKLSDKSIDFIKNYINRDDFLKKDCKDYLYKYESNTEIDYIKSNFTNMDLIYLILETYYEFKEDDLDSIRFCSSCGDSNYTSEFYIK